MWSNPRVPFRLSSDRPPLPPLGGKRLIVHLAMNIEYWPFDRPMPRGIVPAPHGAAATPPDVPNFAWVEYGMRCGLPRIMAMLAERGLPASAFVNAQVADVYPSLMESVVAAGWELVGHGWFQQSLKQAEDEAAVIERSLARLETVSGTRPRAWLGPGLGETLQTADLLKAAGIDRLMICGIVTNGGVASSLRDAHVRGLSTILLGDGCAAFDAKVHEATLTSLGSITRVATCAEVASGLGRRV